MQRNPNRWLMPWQWSRTTLAAVCLCTLPLYLLSYPVVHILLAEVGVGSWMLAICDGMYLPAQLVLDHCELLESIYDGEIRSLREVLGEPLIDYLDRFEG